MVGCVCGWICMVVQVNEYHCWLILHWNFGSTSDKTCIFWSVQMRSTLLHVNTGHDLSEGTPPTCRRCFAWLGNRVWFNCDSSLIYLKDSLAGSTQSPPPQDDLLPFVYTSLVIWLLCLFFMLMCVYTFLGPAVASPDVLREDTITERAVADFFVWVKIFICVYILHKPFSSVKGCQ